MWNIFSLYSSKEYVAKSKVASKEIKEAIDKLVSVVKKHKNQGAMDTASRECICNRVEELL